VTSAQSEERRPINVDVIVSHVSQAPPPPSPELSRSLQSGGDPMPARVREIDERVRRIDAALRGRIVYDQIDLVERHLMVLDVDEVGSVKLPNGERFRVRPMDVGESGVLMAVDIGTKKLDVRAPSGHLVVIGTEPYRDGQLVISVEPRY
jgi:hypothetical protein